MAKIVTPEASDWDNYWSLDKTERFTKISWSKRRIISILNRYIKAGDHALDAGCGSGFFSRFFADQGLNVTALDYSEEALAALIQAGRPVYLDFTASWCVTCQVNKKVVFSSNEVLEIIKSKNVALMRGDWTKQDPTITKALKKYERAGVPLNILYRPGETAPVVFPSLLTAGTVLAELEQIKAP